MGTSIFLIMGNAGFCPSTVSSSFRMFCEAFSEGNRRKTDLEQAEARCKVCLYHWANTEHGQAEGACAHCCFSRCLSDLGAISIVRFVRSKGSSLNSSLFLGRSSATIHQESTTQVLTGCGTCALAHDDRQGHRPSGASSCTQRHSSRST